MDVRHRLIDANGITLHVAEAGEGPAVLFVHGFPDGWRGWRRQMEAVVAEGHRAISLDMRGYGESSRPDDAAAYAVLRPFTRSATCAPIAMDAVRPGLSIPNKLTRPPMPCWAGPDTKKSAFGSAGPLIFGRIPA